MRRTALWLLPVGPLSVGILRFLLPYYNASDNLATAEAVIAHPNRESAVLWLGLLALLTLIPGLVTVAGALPASRLKTWAMALCLPGYLCLGALLAEDHLLFSGAAADTDPQQVAALLSAMHPSINVATGIFVVGHVIGTVLLGLTVLRSGLVQPWIAWLITVSQPLHFVAAVLAGSPALDLTAWTMTGVGLAFVARALFAQVKATTEDGLVRSVSKR